MARLLKRVPFDFNAPLKQVWDDGRGLLDKEPPVGECYQLWEDTTEGSPVTPVFKTVQELAEYCEKNVPIYGYTKQSKDRWLDMINKQNFDFTEDNITYI